MIDVYFCHRYEFATTAADIGYRLGTRCDDLKTNRVEEILTDGYSIDFVDNNFKQRDDEQLLRAVEVVDAELVVLPDVTDTAMIEDVLSLGERIESNGRTPVVVPKKKCVIPSFPSDWVFAYSVPTDYGKTEVPITEFKGKKVHLLGGSPKIQVQYANKLETSGAEIISVDGNSFSKAADFGNIVNYPKEILGGGNGLIHDVDGYDDWGSRIILSLVHNFELWRLWSKRRPEKVQQPVDSW